MAKLTMTNVYNNPVVQMPFAQTPLARIVVSVPLGMWLVERQILDVIVPQWILLVTPIMNAQTMPHVSVEHVSAAEDTMSVVSIVSVSARSSNKMDLIWSIRLWKL